jgi:dihydrofolate synthase/folylpolyglutamate synthase
MPRAYESIKDKIKLPKHIIHIVGTNGKGSSGRFLAHYLYKLGFNVGHYTSPHIMKFNERIWINSEDINDENLEIAHQKLQSYLSEEFLNTLSYFEYTTLLGMIAFEDMDYAILEAGLGGEFDATNVFPKDISLITTIDIDHQSFLGDTIEEIATTKLNSIDKQAIIGNQIHKEVKKIAFSKNADIYHYRDFFSDEELKNIREFIIQKKFASFLSFNLELALSYIKKENLKFDLSLLKDIELKGRLQKIDKNIYIDVGHNPLAANAIKNEFLDKKVDLIYNTYKDKDYKEILTILKDIVDKVYIIDVTDERVEDKSTLIETAKEIGLSTFDYKEFKNEKETIVFGSFSVVEEFLKNYNEK